MTLQEQNQKLVNDFNELINQFKSPTSKEIDSYIEEAKKLKERYSKIKQIDIEYERRKFIENIQKFTQNNITIEELDKYYENFKNIELENRKNAEEELKVTSEIYDLKEKVGYLGSTDSYDVFLNKLIDGKIDVKIDWKIDERQAYTSFLDLKKISDELKKYLTAYEKESKITTQEQLNNIVKMFKYYQKNAQDYYNQYDEEIIILGRGSQIGHYDINKRDIYLKGKMHPLIDEAKTLRKEYPHFFKNLPTSSDTIDGRPIPNNQDDVRTVNIDKLINIDKINAILGELNYDHSKEYTVLNAFSQNEEYGKMQSVEFIKRVNEYITNNKDIQNRLIQNVQPNVQPAFEMPNVQPQNDESQIDEQEYDPDKIYFEDNTQINTSEYNNNGNIDYAQNTYQQNGYSQQEYIYPQANNQSQQTQQNNLRVNYINNQSEQNNNQQINGYIHTQLGYQQPMNTQYQQPMNTQYQQPMNTQYQQPMNTQYQQPNGYMQPPYGYQQPVYNQNINPFFNGIGINKKSKRKQTKQTKQKHELSIIKFIKEKIHNIKTKKENNNQQINIYPQPYGYGYQQPGYAQPGYAQQGYSYPQPNGYIQPNPNITQTNYGDNQQFNQNGYNR